MKNAKLHIILFLSMGRTQNGCGVTVNVGILGDETFSYNLCLIYLQY